MGRPRLYTIENITAFNVAIRKSLKEGERERVWKRVNVKVERDTYSVATY